MSSKIRIWRRWVGMSLPGLIALYVPAVAIVGGVAAVAKIAGIPSGLMTRDPTAILHGRCRTWAPCCGPAWLRQLSQEAPPQGNSVARSQEGYE